MFSAVRLTASRLNGHSYVLVGENACRGMPRIYDGTCFPPFFFSEKARAHAVGGM